MDAQKSARLDKPASTGIPDEPISMNFKLTASCLPAISEMFLIYLLRASLTAQLDDADRETRKDNQKR